MRHVSFVDAQSVARITRVLVLLLTTVFGLGSLAYADAVTLWNTAALNAIRAQRTPPPTASRVLAILHVAIYDAVNGIERSHDPYMVDGQVPRSASMDAAATAAAHDTLVSLFPSYADQFDALQTAQLTKMAEGPQKRHGIAWGRSVADQILAFRATDNFDAIVPPPSQTGIGAWVPTPPALAPYLLPQWGFVTPFGMGENAHFRPLGPPQINSARYTEDYNEVKALGAATGSTRTPEQTLIAEFWADGAGTETPAGHWNTIAANVATAAGNTLVENARLFALLNVAMADAAICAWDAKYFYDFWRPVTAIRNGDADGSPDTVGDPSWSSYLVTPPFPDYVSGHSTFSAAASVILALFFGRDTVMFTTGSDFLPGLSRQFTSFSAAANEAALSRIYGGIHFRSATEDGLKAGLDIGEWTFSHVMRPKGNHSR
jgi:hypothetical protein